MNKERLEYLINEMCCNFLYQDEAQEVIDYIENLQQRITRAIEYIGNKNIGISRKTREKAIKILRGLDDE